MRKEENILKIYTYMYLLSSVIISLMVVVTMQNTGEVAILPMRLERVDVGVIAILHVATLALILPAYYATKNVKLSLFRKEEIHFRFQKEWLHRFVLAILLIQTLYVIQAGYGNAGGNFNNTHPYLTLFLNMMKVDSFFLIYLVCANEKRWIYWFNTILFLGMRLLQGWTGEILAVFVIEAYLYVKHCKRHIPFGSLIKYPFLVSGVAILIGAVLYQILYPLKFFIRGLGVATLSYYEGLKHLVLRLTNFPIDIAAIQNNSKIAVLYMVQGVRNTEIIAFFRSLIPSALFSNKDFSTLNTAILQTVYPEMGGGTSTDYNLFLYLYNLISADPKSFILYIMFFAVLFLATKMLLQCLDDGSGDVNVLYFFLVFQCFYGSSLERVFAYGYIGASYVLVLLFLLGILRISRSQRK